MTRPVKCPPEDLARWKTLALQAALAAVSRPSEPQPALDRAVKGVKNRVVPSGLPSADDPAVRLVRTARRYLSETTAGRRDLQADLLDRADALATATGEPLSDAAKPAPSDDAVPEPGSRLPYRED